MKKAASLGVRLAWLYSLAAAGVFALAGTLIEASVEQHFVEQDMEVMEGKLALARETLGALRTRAELAAMIKAAGIDVRTAVRKREALYTELNLADATDEQLLDAMAEHPILIERPFVVTDKGTRLARPLDAVREIL